VHCWLLLPGRGHLLLPVRPLLSKNLATRRVGHRSYFGHGVVHSPYASVYVGSGTASNERERELE
jgi:hypothetical protein